MQLPSPVVLPLVEEGSHRPLCFLELYLGPLGRLDGAIRAPTHCCPLETIEPPQSILREEFPALCSWDWFMVSGAWDPAGSLSCVSSESVTAGRHVGVCLPKRLNHLWHVEHSFMCIPSILGLCVSVMTHGPPWRCLVKSRVWANSMSHTGHAGRVIVP